MILGCRELRLVLHGLQLHEFWPHIIVVYLEFQHLPIANGIGNDVGMQLESKHVLCCLVASGILTEYRCPGESKLVVLLEFPL